MTRIPPSQWLSRLLGIQGESRKGVRPANESNPAGRADALEVSSQARAALQARSVMAQVPEVRQDRVESLRMQIANGTYRPDARQVAQKILDAGVVDPE